MMKQYVRYAAWAGLVMAAGAVAWAQAGQLGPVPVNSVYTHATGIAVDGHGNLFVADAGAAQVDEILAGTGGAAAGTVSSGSTVVTVGSGFQKPTGVAVDAMGDVFVADAGAAQVDEILAGTGGAAAGTVTNGSTVVAVGSGWMQPSGVAVDMHGDVFVADPAALAVKEIAAGTGSAAAGTVNASSTVTVVGAGFSQPSSVAVDSSGNVYVGDPGSKKLFEIEAGTGGAMTGVVNASSTVVTLTPTNANPLGVSVDPAGDVFFASPVPGAVYEILAGTGSAAPGTVNATSTEVALGNWTTQPTALAANTTGTVFVVASNSVWQVAANSSSGATPVGNFTLTVNQGTSVVSTQEGVTVTVPYSVTSTSGFTGMVSMTCAAPTGYTCQLSPATLSLTQGATQSGTLMVTQPAATAAVQPAGRAAGRSSGALALASLLWMPGMLVGGLAFRRKLARNAGWMRWMGVCLVLLSSAGLLCGAGLLSGCNYPNPNFKTHQTSYQVTVMVTASGGTVQQNVPLYLQVQLPGATTGTTPALRGTGM